MKAMIRETKEEANLDIKKNWKLYHKDILANVQINTYYQKIFDALNLPYHLDGIIIDEFNNIISDIYNYIKI